MKPFFLMITALIASPCRAIVGAATPMRIKVLPESFPDSQIKWRVVSGTGSFAGGDAGRDVMFVAGGADGEEVVLQVDVGDVQGVVQYLYFSLHPTTQNLSYQDRMLAEFLPAYSNSIQRLETLRHIAATTTNSMTRANVQRRIDMLSAIPTNQLNDIGWIAE